MLIDNEIASEKLKQQIVFEWQKYICSFDVERYWKYRVVSTYRLAKERLIGHWKKFQIKEYEVHYHEAVYAYLEDNYAEELPKQVKLINFIPHQLVITEMKKPRLVYACNIPGKVSLNEIMLKGSISSNKIKDKKSKWKY